MHKDHNNEEVFINDNHNNNNNNNGNGYEEIKQEVAELRDVVEEIKWSMKGFVKFSKRKKITEENSIKDKVGYILLIVFLN